GGPWAQAGYDFTPHWSLWGYYGLDQPDAGKFAQDHPTVVGGLPRQQSHEGDVLLRFRAGRYALGLEYYRSVVRYNTGPAHADQVALSVLDRKSTRLNSSHQIISYAVFCLKKKKIGLEK